MLIYFAYYALIGIGAYLSPRIKTNRAKTLLFLTLFLGLFFIIGFRHPSMGVDLQYGKYNGYLDVFSRIANGSWKDAFSKSYLNYERGFIVFNKLISCISDNQQFLLICSAILSLLPIFIIFKKYSVNFEFSIIIYMSLTCFLMTFSGLRQACAIGICISSYKFIKERKLIPFILLVLLATSFHTTAILFLVTYPMYAINIKKKFRFLTLALIALVFVFRSQLFSLLAPLIKETAVADNNGAIGLFLVFILIYIFCIVFCDDSKETSGLLNLFLLAVFCQAFGNIYNTAGRVGYYFMPFLGLLLPKTISNLKGKEKSIILIVLVIVFVGYGLYSIYGSGSSFAEAYPWIPCWSTNV